MREELLFHWPKVVDVEQVGPEVLNVGRYRALKDFTWSRIKDAANRGAGNREKVCRHKPQEAAYIKSLELQVFGCIEFEDQESSNEKTAQQEKGFDAKSPAFEPLQPGWKLLILSVCISNHNLGAPEQMKGEDEEN